MTLTFTTLDDRPGIEIIDRIERQRYRLHTPSPVSPTPVDADAFHFPVGSAVAIRTSEIVLPTVVPVYVRDAEGNMVAEVKQFEAEAVPDGSYSIDLCTRIKTYLRADAEFEVSVDMEQTRIDFGEPTEVRVGARSRHDRPAATVTTTEDPLDMMAAVETFGSALKTTDPERSYPTLRGHPPALELGDSLDVPSGVERPDTGVHLELPPDLPSIFVAAPLAYYLGASVRPGPSPRLTTDDGFEHALTGPDGYEREVERVLKQLFFLDCLTRTEGYYEIDLHERRAVEPYVDLDFESLYYRPLAEQVAEYLTVPYDVVEEHVPEWRLTAHVDPVARNAEQLPFVVDDLAIVRTHQPHQKTQTSVTASVEQEFTRSSDFTRAASAEPAAVQTDYVEPQSESTLEQAWIGDGVPIGASKLTPEAFKNRLDREAADGDISITVVQNDARMAEERQIADEVYGNREDLPFDITVRENLTTDELADALARQSDFFHYIGHIDADGFTCEDGALDVRTLDSVGVDTFLLNACSSYQQGLGLIDGGAIGGIVTLNEVLNDGAVKIGETVARLLNCGFPLRAALTIARDESILGGQYIVVGDGGITVTQPGSGTPDLLEIEKEGDYFNVEMTAYATDERGLGSILTPFLKEHNSYYLSSGHIDTFSLSKEELGEFLQLEEGPVRISGDVHWSSTLDINSVF
ncbi:hypothetical protein [Haloarcula nitratireducens]|uniref:CHAT domain-containing protein n=1 Tax=Haloarcula nitratireducens TaxID=2487749 RepID=A0AAW4P7R5_9EURY|nr:hypothetical protein [Halomicroarcula nitratireducens]MBX0293615.1 hypothetical protein [Halomicroarcula nitratireducens]